MRKRIIAMICILAHFMAFIPVATVFAEAGDKAAFRVGYAKVDINPWVDPNDHSKGILPIPLGGYGDTESRLSMGVADDDGVAGESGNEGLFATCIAVTDDDDNTMLFIAYDGINSDDEMVNSIREGIVAGVTADSALAANTNVSHDQIMVSASHSHFAPDFTTVTKARLVSAQGSAAGAQLWEIYSDYKARVTQQMIDVALDALRDRETVSEVKKTETDAKAVTGYQLNGVRHYELTGYSDYNYLPIAAVWGGSVYNFDGDELTWFAGDNFACNRYAVQLGIQLGEYSASSPSATYGAMGTYYVKKAEHVTEANDTLYTLEFSFDSGKDTIMLANWRGHTTINENLDKDADGNLLENPSGLLHYDYAARTGDTYTFKSKSHYVSGDYFNAFRNLMKAQGYDVAMINGAGGNINNGSRAFDPSVGSDGWGGNISWSRFFDAGELTDIDGAKIPTTDMPATAFSKLLVRVAMDTTKKITTVCTPGTIRNKQVRYSMPENDYGIDLETEIEAWTAAYTACETAQNAGTAHYPYKYTHTDGKVCVVNSRFHCSYIKSWLLRNKGKRAEDADYAKLELNAIMLGEQIAFVSAPGEMFDYYDANGSREAKDNDWLELIDETYGTPFVLGYSNGRHSYMPNTLAFDYNAQHENIGLGSYEANSSQIARGQGEEIIVEFGRLLDYLNGKSAVTVKNDYCEACGKPVEWEPLVAQNNGDKYWYSGHYYLYEDINDAYTNTKRIRGGETVCLDLNGKRLQTNERIGGRSIVVETSATLNIMDLSEEKTGVISGQGQIVSYNHTNGSYSYENGGTIYAQARSTLSLYGGTIERRVAKDPYYAYSYDADGGYYRLVEDFGVELGGTIYVHATANFNAYGGVITNGTAVTAGDCVYSQSTSATNGGFVTLSGAANIAQIYFKSATPQNYLTVDGVYTGSADLTLQSAEKDQVVGKLTDDGDISGARITCGDLYVTASGTDLVLTDEQPGTVAAMIGNKAYSSVDAAVKDYTGGEIQLLANETEAVKIPENITVTIDLNGFDLQDVEVKGTLQVKDSKTDDYNVNDNDYGKITGTITGTVQAVPVTNGEGYLQVTEDEGVSFHKVHLSVTDMVMSASKVSIYYNCKFAGDEKVQGLVDQYGMAISLNGTPTVDAQTKTFTEDCQYSWFNDFKAGENKASSTRLYDIMKPDNGYLNNRDNANAPIYIRAYIKLKDGSYLLGRDYDRGFSLRNLLEAVGTEEGWIGLMDGQQKELITMYREYTTALSECNIPALKDAAAFYTMDGKRVSQVKICTMSGDNVGYTDSAVLLADSILRTTGKKPYFGTFSASGANQIVITNAQSAAAYLPEGVTVGDMQYVICRNGSNIFVIANDEMGAELGMRQIEKAIRNMDLRLELSDLCTDDVVTYTYGQNLQLEADAEYRIMTYNVERDELGGEGRYGYALNSILFYNPDVIGFQEYCVGYTENLTPQLESNGYTLIADEVVTTEGQAAGADRYSMTNNYTPIAYKTGKFKLLDSGWQRLIPGDYNSYGWTGYCVTWAVLQDKTTGEVFAVTAHHNLASSADGAAETRKEALSKVITLVRDTIVAKYDCPVFVVGDYNTSERAVDYLHMAAQPEFNDARYIAERGYAVGDSHGEKGEVVCTGTTRNCIDHMFVVGDARVLRHRYAHATQTALASDHKPVFIDVIVGEKSGEIDTTNVFTGVTTMHINTGVSK